MADPATINATGKIYGSPTVYYKLVAAPAADGAVFDGSVQTATPDDEGNLSLSLYANAEYEFWADAGSSRGEHQPLLTGNDDCLIPALISGPTANP